MGGSKLCCSIVVISRPEYNYTMIYMVVAVLEDRVCIPNWAVEWKLNTKCSGKWAFCVCDCPGLFRAVQDAGHLCCMRLSWTLQDVRLIWLRLSSQWSPPLPPWRTHRFLKPLSTFKQWSFHMESYCSRSFLPQWRGRSSFTKNFQSNRWLCMKRKN